MSKITAMIAKFWPYFLVAVVSCFYLLPFLAHPSFNLIDDGLNLQAGQRVYKDFTVKTFDDVLIQDELKLGRMRPFYFLFYVGLFFIVGSSATGFWVAQLTLLIVTLFLINYIIFFHTQKKILSVIATLLLLVAPSFAENYFRLGTAETKQVIPMLLLIVLFQHIDKKGIHKFLHAAAAMLFLIIPLFIKETAIIMFGWITILFSSHWLKRKWMTPSTISLWLVMLLSIISFVLILPKGDGYSSDYTISYSVMKESALVLRIIKAETIWLLVAGIFVFSFRFSYQLLQKKISLDSFINQVYLNRWMLSFIGLACASIIILLPWKYKLERYFYFTEILTVILLAIEIVLSYQFWVPQLLKLYAKKQYSLLAKRLTWLAAGVFALLILTKLVFPTSPWNFKKLPLSTWKNLTTWYTQYQYSGAVTNYLLSSISPDEIIVIDYHDYEVVYELGIFASKLGAQPVTIISPNEQVEKDFGGIYSTSDNLAADIASSSTKKLLVRGTTKLDTTQLTEIVLWPADTSLVKDESMVWKVYYDQQP